MQRITAEKTTEVSVSSLSIPQFFRKAKSQQVCAGRDAYLNTQLAQPGLIPVAEEAFVCFCVSPYILSGGQCVLQFASSDSKLSGTHTLC